MSQKSPYLCIGDLAEWSIASVLKTEDCHRSGGSNPSVSAAIVKKSRKALIMRVLRLSLKCGFQD